MAAEEFRRLVVSFCIEKYLFSFNSVKILSILLASMISHKFEIDSKIERELSEWGPLYYHTKVLWTSPMGHSVCGGRSTLHPSKTTEHFETWNCLMAKSHVAVKKNWD